MVAHPGESAKRNSDMSWPALTGCDPRAALRGSSGIGLHVAKWAANQGYAVLAMMPVDTALKKIEEAERLGIKGPSRKQPLEKWKYLEYRPAPVLATSTIFRRRCGVSIITGPSGLVVLDIDGEEGEEWLRQLADGREFSTRMLRTHKGRHFIFSDDGVNYKTTNTKTDSVAPGVDVRGYGGIELIYDPSQPERHFTDLRDPIVMPEWLANEIPLAGSRSGAGKSRSGGGGIDRPKLYREGVPHGEHNSTMLPLAMSMVNKNEIDRKSWYRLARTLIQLGSGDECDCTDEVIYGWYDTAVAKKKAEDKKSGRKGNNYAIDKEEADQRKKERAEIFQSSEIIQSAADVEESMIDWVWPRYIPIGTLTQLDGEKGTGKTHTYIDIAARASRGWPMPGEDRAACDPMNVFIFTEEIAAHNRKKLRAAGADLSRIFYPHPEFQEKIVAMIFEKKNATEAIAEIDESYTEILIPTATDLVLEMVRKAKAGMVIWDPISQYVDTSQVDMNKDPSVRRALEPLTQGLAEMHAAGLMVRHMNKDEKASAGNRGLGSTAFQNVARVHLVMNYLPDEYQECGSYGLAMVSNNHTRTVRGTLAFDVIDTDIKLDGFGNWVGKIVWNGLEESITADMLVRGTSGGNGSSRGPKPHMRAAIKRILAQMGKKKNVWDAAEGMEYIKDKLEEQGLGRSNDNTITKARRESLVDSKPRKGASGFNDWIFPAITVHRT